MARIKDAGDWEALYYQLGQIIAEEPKFRKGGMRGSTDVLRWLGRAEALVREVGTISDIVKFEANRNSLLTATALDPENYLRHLRSLLYSALAQAEMNAPAVAKAAFIPAGSAFDALTAVSSVLRECRGFALIVDPYMDGVALTDFFPMIRDGTRLQLLASGKQKSSGLLEAVRRWKDQYGDTKPIEVRFAAARTLHDRLIMDEANVWSLSQSFNSMAHRSPAMLQRVSADIASAKRGAFMEIWDHAEAAIHG